MIFSLQFHLYPANAIIYMLNACFFVVFFSRSEFLSNNLCPIVCFLHLFHCYHIYFVRLVETPLSISKQSSVTSSDNGPKSNAPQSIICYLIFESVTKYLLHSTINIFSLMLTVEELFASECECYWKRAHFY